MTQSTDDKILAKQVPGNPDMPRDAYADVLAWHYHHGDPQDGERVRAFDRKSGTFIAEGTWEYRLDQPSGSSMAVVHTDDAGAVSIPGSVRLQVVTALPRRRPPVLTEPELHVAAELLEELGAVYAGEKLGDLATAVVTKIVEGLELYSQRPQE